MAKTEYRLHGVRLIRNRENGRDITPLDPPEIALQIAVGKSERLAEITLTPGQAALLVEDTAAALRQRLQYDAVGI